jgi:hypothetical protein
VDPVPEHKPTALGRLLATSTPISDEPEQAAVCGKKTMRQDAEGNWLPCSRPQGHKGGCWV